MSKILTVRAHHLTTAANLFRDLVANSFNLQNSWKKRSIEEWDRIHGHKLCNRQDASNSIYTPTEEEEGGAWKTAHLASVGWLCPSSSPPPCCRITAKLEP